MAFYEHPVNTLTGKPANLEDYKGKAALVVNVASMCGLTPQYEGLQKLQMFEKIEVNGDNKDGLYAELEETADVADGHTGDIRWNFEKFLVSPSGEVVGRFSPTVEPLDPALVGAIEAQLPS